MDYIGDRTSDWEKETAKLAYDTSVAFGKIADKYGVKLPRVYECFAISLPFVKTSKDDMKAGIWRHYGE